MIIRWNRDQRGWKKRFAFLPICISDGPQRTIIWLEWHWRRASSEWIEVSLTDPMTPQAIEAGTAEGEI